jgi:imidazoleglycerol-phosphate dehydratase
MSNRSASLERSTRETQIKMTLNLDGTGVCECDTGVPFLEHMLEQVARHGLIDLTIHAKGDLHIDAHHTVEDIGITLGQCLDKALGDKKGIQRYGHAYVPLDESLSRIVLDLSGRPGLSWNVTFPQSTVGGLDVELFQEFFQGLVNHGKITLHADNLRGSNTHHIAETLFKALGRALRMACAIDPAVGDATPSTKGML